MAAADAEPSYAKLALQGKRAGVQTLVNRCVCEPAILKVGEVIEYAFTRDGITFMGGIESSEAEKAATDDDWNRVLSEGLATKFKVEWSLPKYPKEDLRVLRHGEPLFYNLRGAGLSPDWDGTPEGDFTITAVDKLGARLVLAMALHPRLGANSRMSLMKTSVVRLIADMAVDFSEGNDFKKGPDCLDHVHQVWGRERWGWPSPGGTPFSCPPSEDVSDEDDEDGSEDGEFWEA
ncbi:hypothetical protein T484DRAFT_1805069 [Baffinella frigidus]|nr:hypothetical protein T484DRAFT_1805069 [Cryptophyta sp. CCMP2293]